MTSLVHAAPTVTRPRGERQLARTRRTAPGPVRRPEGLAPEDVLALQESAGNAAVARLLRQPATGAPTAAPTLKAARFADNDRLQSAARSSPPLRRNEVDDAVARMQRAFVDLGYKMPSGPDGIYGGETVAAVRRFQEEHGVPHPSGHEAGKKTLTKLDEVFLKRDAPIDSTPPAVTGVAIQSTKRALEAPDSTVTPPEAKVTPTSVEPGKESEHEHRLQVEVSGGLEGDIHLGGKKPPEEKPNFLCDHVKVKLDIKGNINVVKLGNVVTLLPSVGVTTSASPSACAKAPGVEAHIDLLKLKLSEATEIGVTTSFQPEPKDIGLGWILKAPGVTFQVKPSKSLPLFVALEGAVGVQRVPLGGGTGHFHWFLEGGLVVGVEFGFF